MMLQRNSMITGRITEEYVKSNCAFIILFFYINNFYAVRDWFI